MEGGCSFKGSWRGRKGSGSAGLSFPDNYSGNRKVSSRKEATRPHTSYQTCVSRPLIPEMIPSKGRGPIELLALQRDPPFPSSPFPSPGTRPSPSCPPACLPSLILSQAKCCPSQAKGGEVYMYILAAHALHSYHKINTTEKYGHKKSLTPTSTKSG